VVLRLRYHMLLFTGGCCHVVSCITHTHTRTHTSYWGFFDNFIFDNFLVQQSWDIRRNLIKTKDIFYALISLEAASAKLAPASTVSLFLAVPNFRGYLKTPLCRSKHLSSLVDTAPSPCSCLLSEVSGCREGSNVNQRHLPSGSQP
jgi:hypothetical protein